MSVESAITMIEDDIMSRGSSSESNLFTPEHVWLTNAFLTVRSKPVQEIPTPAPEQQAIEAFEEILGDEIVYTSLACVEGSVLDTSHPRGADGIQIANHRLYDQAVPSAESVRRSERKANQERRNLVALLLRQDLKAEGSPAPVATSQLPSFSAVAQVLQSDAATHAIDIHNTSSEIRDIFEKSMQHFIEERRRIETEAAAADTLFVQASAVAKAVSNDLDAKAATLGKLREPLKEPRKLVFEPLPDLRSLPDPPQPPDGKRPRKLASDFVEAILKQIDGGEHDTRAIDFPLGRYPSIEQEDAIRQHISARNEVRG
jgi:hypothetical protein